jgi:hypothetical protein
VARLLGPAARPRQPVRARADVSQGGDEAWRVELATSNGGDEGRRTLSAASCAALADATALILALMIDPNAGAPRAPPPPPAAAPPPAPFSLGALATTDLGTMPRLAAGVRLSAALRVERWRLGAYGAYWPGASATLDDRPGIEGHFSLAVAGAEGCRSGRVGARGDWALCAGVELDAARARSSGVRDPGEAGARWGAFAANVEVAWPVVGPLSVIGRATVVRPWQRQDFVIEGVGPIYQTKFAALRLALGLGMSF